MHAPMHLRAATPDDAALLAAWLNDPATNRLLTSNLRGGGLDAKALALGLRRRDQVWMLFAESAEAPPAGLIALDGIDRADGVANLWFLLGDKAQARRGLTSAAIAAFCAANPADLHVATAWIVAENAASAACLRRAGFAQAGRIDEAVLIDGKRQDRILFQRRFGA